MISVLIPVYNYDVVSLVKELHSQLIENEIAFEIYCGDDASDSCFVKKNTEINELTHTSYSVSKYNIGREQTRQLLSAKAKYDWLLFLDADTFPVESTFIKSYLPYLNSDYDAVFGGIMYHKQQPPVDQMLRWKYGMLHEAVSANKRNQNPYQTIVSANFIIKKDKFIYNNEKINGKEYGYDILFGALLKSSANKVFHIDNQVYHLGIEKSVNYLQKKEYAAQTYLNLFNCGTIKAEDSRLLSTFLMLKRYKFNYLFSIFFSLFQPTFKRNLLNGHPSIKLLQLYRICYICYIDIKPSN